MHRQYSGYVSKKEISMADVANIVVALSNEFSWLKVVVMGFDVTTVGKNIASKIIFAV